MFQFLSNIFSKKSKPAFQLDFRTISFGEIENYPDAISDLYKGSLDGLLIKNVLSNDQANKVASAFKKLPFEELIKTDGGMTNYPVSFAQITQKTNGDEKLLQDYFLECVDFESSVKSLKFGTDFLEQIRHVLESMAGGKKICNVPPENMPGHYTPGNFRSLEPEKGSFKAHCGNYFQNEFPQFYGNISRVSVIENQLSYFLLVAPSEEGGELTVFDLLWKNVQIRLKGDKVLKGMKGKLYDLENEKKVWRTKIKPEKGDMILFAGGRIWHQVEMAKGTKERLTFGGFITRAKDDSAYYMWS